MATEADVRRIALALPQVVEQDHFQAPSFRVNAKSFAILREMGRVTLKFEPEDQRNLVALHPDAIEPVPDDGGRAGRAGRAGWTLVRYAGLDEALLTRLLRLAWSGVAPPRLRDA